MLDLPRAVAHVWLLSLPEPTPENAPWHRYELLDELEQQRAARIVHAATREQYVAAHVLLRLCLSRYAPLAPAAWRFVCNAYGRPRLDPALGVDLEFNLSHTHGLVACVVARALEVGVDVESLVRRHPGLRLATRFFAPQEVAALRATRGALQDERFLELWTLKEAYIKARGLGLALPLRDFAFLGTAAPIQIAMQPTLDDVPAGWNFTLAHLASGHVLATALRAVDAESWRVVCKAPADSLALLSRSGPGS